MTFEERDLIIYRQGTDAEMFIGINKCSPVCIRLDGILIDHIEMINNDKFWLSSCDWCLNYCCCVLNDFMKQYKREIICQYLQHSDKYVNKFTLKELDYKHLKCILLSGNPKPKSNIECIFLNFSYDAIFVNSKTKTYGLK